MNFAEFYKNKNILVSGGSSFIGSHLVDQLILLNSNVTVIDDLSSGKKSNLEKCINEVNFIELDLRERNMLQQHFENVDIVFHLAAIHGGRGFIENYQQEMLDNFTIDTNVFSLSKINGIKNIVHASSACAYPIFLQNSETKLNLLEEDQANFIEPGKAFPDGVYGWTKLMGEYQLQVTAGEQTQGRSARIFTAYGERENLSHAAVALIAKSVLQLDPFPVWGSGLQTRNFTHVSDTVKGLLYLGADERKLTFDVFNIGTSAHVRVIDFINEIHNQLGWKPKEWNFQLDKPMGVASRASDNSKIFDVFGWQPDLSISEGIKRTIEWYLGLEDKPSNLDDLNSKLMAR